MPERFLAEKGMEINDLRNKANKSLRADLVKLLMEKSNLSLRGIAAILGMNHEMIRKLAVSKNLSP